MSQQISMEQLLGEQRGCESCRFNAERTEFDIKRCTDCSRRVGYVDYQPIPTAADLFVEWFTMGYVPMKVAEKKKEQVKSKMQVLLRDSEIKRHPFENINVVAKWVRKSVYETDYEGLKEYLSDLGRYRFACEIDHKLVKADKDLKSILEPYIKYTPTNAVPSLNKAGKELIQTKELDLEGFGVEYLATSWRNLQMRHTQF